MSINSGGNKVIFDNIEEALNIFGQHDENLVLIEEKYHVQIIARGNELTINGAEDEIAKVINLFGQLKGLNRAGNDITARDVLYVMKLIENGNQDKIYELAADILLTTYRGKTLKPKTHGQQRYVEAIKKDDIVFGIGPAGTGKTYLAVAMAAQALRNKQISRIILTRPAVEAGEKLGFLPGDLQEKVNPYLRPLYDGLYDILGAEKTQKYLEKGVIEIAPLAYMRGRTLDDSFIILDEAQNTTPEQMKMFLTRLGTGSKAVITGDITQVDLPRGQYSGLVDASQKLGEVAGISFRYFTSEDVQRHQLVQKIIEAYENN